MFLTNEHLTDRDCPNFFIEIDEQGETEAVYTEYLEWHQNRDSELMEQLSDKQGWLTKKSLSAVSEIVAKELKQNTKGLTVKEGTSDYPSIEVSILLGNSYKTEEAVWNAGYNLYATMINLTDPGTFGSPYLFNEVARKL